MYNDIRRRLKDEVGRKRTEKQRTNSRFHIHNNAPAHRVGSGQGLLSKELRNNTGAPPDLTPADFYLFPRSKSPLKGWGFCVVTNIITMQRKSWKGFQKMASTMSATSSQSLAEMYSSTRGLFGKKCSLNDCTVLYFLRHKVIMGTFWSYNVRCWQLCTSRCGTNWNITW